MIYYAVDMPRTEGQGDGEDCREWFRTKTEAQRRFHELVRDCKRFLAARDRYNKAWSSDENPDDLWEEVESLDPRFIYYEFSLERYDVPTDRVGLFDAISSQMNSCRSVIKEWRSEG